MGSHSSTAKSVGYHARICCWVDYEIVATTTAAWGVSLSFDTMGHVVDRAFHRKLLLRFPFFSFLPGALLAILLTAVGRWLVHGESFSFSPSCVSFGLLMLCSRSY